VDDGLIRLAATQVAGVVVALVVFWLARRRPRTTGVLIGSSVIIGFGLIWLGAYLSEDDFEAGRRCFQVGILGVLYGLPAPVLFQWGRWTGPFVGPGRAPESVKAVGAYLGAWWVCAFVVGGIAMLGMAQAGSFR
jgi:hypothetical protein